MNQINRPRAVVFDLDGTMINTEELYPRAAEKLLARRNKEFNREVLDRMIGRRAHAALSAFKEVHELEEEVDDLIAESQALLHEIMEEDLAPMPGLLELLDRLEMAEIPRAVATSSRRSFVEHVFQRFDLAERFAFVLSAEDVTRGKPHPEIYLAAAERFDLSPAEVLVLEDSAAGFQAARAAGTIAVAVPGPHSHRHDFAGAALVLESLADAKLMERLHL